MPIISDGSGCVLRILLSQDCVILQASRLGLDALIMKRDSHVRIGFLSLFIQDGRAPDYRLT